MRKTISFLTLILAAGICHGATKEFVKKDQKQEQQKAIENKKPQKAVSKPTGPVGLGAIKIGMLKEAILQLQQEDGVYLAEPLTEYKNKYYTPKPGVEKYATKINLPNESNPIESVLTFSDNQLKEIYFDFEKSPYLYDRLKSQITEKYNQGTEKDDRKEEQCIYKNGANFKITSGVIATTWRQEFSDGEVIETRLTEFKFQMCPFNLMYGSVGGAGGRSLTIRKLDKVVEAEKNSIF